MEATREAPLPSLSLEHYILHEYARAGGTGDVADRRRFAHLLVLLKTFLDAIEGSTQSAGSAESTASAGSAGGAGGGA